MDECVHKVGKQVLKESKAAKNDFKSYKKHIDRDDAAGCISETLLKLLSAINPKFKHSLQAIMVGNFVTCQPTPLKIAFGVVLGDNKIIITELYKYNVCCSYD